MLLLLLSYFVAATIGFVSVLVLYARWHYGFLERLGIPVEPPTFLLGSTPKMYETNPQLEDIKRFQKYGTVFGLYEGRSPQVFIADPNLVRNIMVKEYEHFSSRSPVNLGHEISNEILDYLPDDKWKHVRSLLAPPLSTMKLKPVIDVSNEVGREFVKGLLEELGGREKMVIDFRNRIVCPLVDITATGLYGLEIENRKDPDNAMVDLMRTVLCEDVTYDWRYTLMNVFPFLKFFFPSWPFPTHGLESFRRILLGYLKTRLKKPGHKTNDLGDVFVHMMTTLESPQAQKLGMTQATAMAQVVEVFFATYDSVSTAITMFAYFMAHNPRIQDKVLEEVDAVWSRYNGDIGTEAINDLVYMTACLNEAMRLYPPFIRPERLCTKSWIGQMDNGLVLRLPKGANVVIPIYAMHRHPDYFPEPDKYDPDRFLPGYQPEPKLKNPYAFAPFGHGPKNCIGMKLAYNNMKILLSRVMKEFKFRANERTQIEFKKGTIFVTQFKPIYFDLVKR